MNSYTIIAYLFSVSVLLSCGPGVSREELIQQEVQKKAAVFMHKKEQACREYILQEAEIFVDSILYLEIGTSLQGAEIIPDRPSRKGDTLGYDILLDTSKPEAIPVDSVFPD